MTKLTEPRTRVWRIFAWNMYESLIIAKLQGQSKAATVVYPLRKWKFLAHRRSSNNLGCRMHSDCRLWQQMVWSDPKISSERPRVPSCVHCDATSKLGMACFCFRSCLRVGKFPSVHLTCCLTILMAVFSFFDYKQRTYCFLSEQISPKSMDHVHGFLNLVWISLSQSLILSLL